MSTLWHPKSVPFQIAFFLSLQQFKELSKIKIRKCAFVIFTVNICMLLHSQIAKRREDKE